ncbi:MAG: LacI family DNA-binding transcriptional regulator [Lachnospiraceae bacterium]|jgi:DNA-binding LacI/PurR family transcriptional regulator|nr:LacI family DNA-binding transcriptional regulator [Lachnospiraceae bacterium]
MSKAVRLSDIGQRAGVSAVAVSKALSGQKGVSEEMRAKIVALASEMGYVKTVGSKESKNRRTYTLGVIVAEHFLQQKQSFYWKMYQEIARRAISKNCFTILEVIGQPDENQMKMPKVVLEKKADGIVIMGDFKPGYSDAVSERSGLPVVFLDTTRTGGAGDCVVSNNLMGGYSMTNYLFSMGHSRIAFVGTRLSTASIEDRFLGYLKSLMEHGVKWREDWFIDDRSRETGLMDTDTYPVLPKDMPTAFFCNCDLSASILIEKLTRKGYRVPEDFSVAGFDDYVPEQYSGVGITTYEIDMAEMARRTVHILTHKIDDISYSTGMFMLPGTFIERQSAARIGSPVPFV